MLETTFGIIKPDAVEDRHIGQILTRIEYAGATRYAFTIERLKMHRISRSEAELLYAEHKDRPFFGDLVHFITSGPSVLLALGGDKVIAGWRKLMGATDPAKADAGTIRHAWGSRHPDTMYRNCVHGSDSPAAAARELELFFSGVTGATSR